MIHPTKWSIDQSHSEIAFMVKHLMISYVKGKFKSFDALIYTSGKDFRTAEIDLSIDASSISTDDITRDKHLSGPDFFDAEHHKKITFRSSGLEKPDADGKHELSGELTIKGITKNIQLQVKFCGIVNDPYGNEKAGFSVSGKINRSDWGLNWDTITKSGSSMLGEEIIISCEVELINVTKWENTKKLENLVEKEMIL